MLNRLLAWAALGILASTAVAACGSSSSTPVIRHGDGGSGGGSGGGEFDAAGPRTITGFTGVTMCGEPVDAGWMQWNECAISVPVSGGLSGYIDVPNLVVICGDSSSSGGLDDINWGTSAGNDTSVSFSASFTSPVPLDTTGTFPATITISETALDGGTLARQTPAGACSIVIAGSLCVDAGGTGPDGGSRQERILSGTGSCAQPAMAQSGANAPPVSIGTFQFLETIGP